MEAFLEFLLEVILEFYMELMTLFVPEKKIKKVYLKLLAGIWAAILFISDLVAIVMLAQTNGGSTAGKIILAVSLLITAIQITTGLVLIKRKNK